jgi:hypothetical protein
MIGRGGSPGAGETSSGAFGEEVGQFRALSRALGSMPPRMAGGTARRIHFP